jgi:virulence factor Mce-like protein
MRALVIGGALAALIAGCGGGGGHAVHYRIELDNAFDLTKGGDLKIAGVAAGSITGLSVDRRRLTAIADVALRPGAAPPLRADARCITRPQSLLGEYFINCDPGRARKLLPDGALIPTSRTQSTIPQDLVNDILRVPERERLRLIVNEFGTALAARGEDLNTAIRKGDPALRETDRVLADLAGQRRTLARLATNADRVVTALANRRRDVARFVRTAGRTAAVAAARRDQLRAGFRRLPAFLTQLRATMADLDAFSRAQTPTARALGRVAGPLGGFLDDVPPFARAAKPAVHALGGAAVAGRDAVKAAAPAVAKLNTAATGMPELSANLRIVAEHLTDRKFGVQHDERAVRQLAPPGPGGDRYTGVDAILQYVFDQTLSANMFTQNGHFLTTDAIAGGPCANYHDAASVRNDPALEKQCSGNVIGPSSPGIHDPDPGKPLPTSGPALRALQDRRADLRITQQAASAHSSGGAGASAVLGYLLSP